MGGGRIISGTESKRFFFEKKNQKTFMTARLNHPVFLTEDRALRSADE
jgi:hypothetical protein